MTQAQLGKALGVDQGLISRWVKRGMPLDSVEAAAKWRKAHTNSSYSRKPKAPTKLPAGAPTIEDAEKVASEPIRAGSPEEVERYLRDLEESRTWAKRNADSLFKAGDVEDARKWLVAHQNIANRYPIIRKELMRQQKEYSELLVAKDVEAAVAAHMAKLRSIVDSWPAALAAKCNPSDPELARMQLESARDQLFRAMSAKA